MGTVQEEARKELAMRKLEQKYRTQRESLLEFMKFYWKEEKKEELMVNRHIEQICDKLEAVYAGEIKRLIINMPPRSLKTELISKAFPIWMMGNDQTHKVMEISYSSDLAEGNSQGARNMYKSHTYKKVFPRASDISDDQDTKKHWTTVAGGQYYAAGSSGTITGIGADTIIIDDPLKPTDAESDVVRKGVNNNYDNTIKSRLNDRKNGAIIIVMQRLHDDDLCGYLMEREKQGIGDKRDKLVIPAIGTEDRPEYKAGESFFEGRFPIDMLQVMKKENPVIFSTQYQQDPVSKETQEFHEEWFRYYTIDKLPNKYRVFTTCDPAFSKKDTADNTAIITAAFDGMDMYVLEMSVGKYNPAELIDKLIYHYIKWKPEKIGIEAFQAQQIIGFNLRAELDRRGHSVNIEDIRQTGDKETKIRKLIPLYRNGHIYHQIGMDNLEFELKRFPRGRHDDIIDAMQMLYTMYEAMPNAKAYKGEIKIEYDDLGRPIMVTDGDSTDIF